MAPAILPLPARMQRGISFVHSWGSRGARGYGSPASRESLAELRALGATWVSVMPFGFMSSLDSDTVHLIEERSGPAKLIPLTGGETDSRVRQQIADAHALGMKVLLKPHIWIGSGAWCGNIDAGSPEAWERFFASYERFLSHYAALAQETSADLFAVGVEMGSTTARFPERWRALITRARALFRGPLVYAANWDEVPRVPFWDLLDFIGTQFYPPLAESPDATEATMALRLEAQLDQLAQIAQKTGRSVLFTEVGYKSIVGTAIAPHLWPEDLPRSVVEAVSQEAQAMAFRVFLTSIARREWAAGLYVWKWFSDPESSEEGPDGFSPRRKQAEAILRAAFKMPNRAM